MFSIAEVWQPGRFKSIHWGIYRFFSSVIGCWSSLFKLQICSLDRITADKFSIDFFCSTSFTTLWLYVDKYVITWCFQMSWQCAWIGHLKDLIKLTFRELAICQSEWVESFPFQCRYPPKWWSHGRISNKRFVIRYDPTFAQCYA